MPVLTALEHTLVCHPVSPALLFSVNICSKCLYTCSITKSYDIMERLNKHVKWKFILKIAFVSHERFCLSLLI